MATPPPMQPLSPTVAYGDPGQQQQQRQQRRKTDDDQDPDLVLIFSWMGAREEHIAKYLTQHRRLFPTSPILLVRCPLSRVWLPWLARRDMAPVLPLLRALINDGSRRRPRILVHIFSNGGISTAVHLQRMIRADNEAKSRGKGKDIDVLPALVLLLDSCPGYFHWHRTHRAVMAILPWWTSPLIHVAIAVACLYYALRRLPASQDRNARALNLCDCRRTYLYGTADDMVDYRDVEDNAGKAADAGFAVRMERFDGGRHVALAMAYPERYWAAVRRSWREAS
ncbi:hypothetical protein CP532_3708 [Ophiocordyceps camponoti-leonardi (nom. inval.)]|nr:hypothetical protein CP532_3708 [Ophiocordyceps camponoti-leonardi (nom. inval.)]